MPGSRLDNRREILTLLKRSLVSGRLGHSYIFDGADPAQTMAAALDLIAAAFCESPDACGNCPSCTKLESRHHPDLHIIGPDGTYIKIDQIRELQRELSFRPYESNSKACIIENADCMNPAAANAFLKTLEEPPGDALIVLLTTRPDKLLPTILSRCQRLRFPQTPTEAIAAAIHDQGSSLEDSRVAAALSGGSFSRAQEIIGDDLITLRRQLLEQAATASTADIAHLFDISEHWSKDRESALTFVHMLQIFWRDAMLVSVGGANVISTDLMDLIAGTVRRLTTKEILTRLETTLTMQRALLGNANPRLAAEVTLLELECGRKTRQ